MANQLKGMGVEKDDEVAGAFPNPKDVVLKLSNGANAFIGKHTYGVELIKLHLWESKNSFSVGRFTSIAHTQFFLAGNHPKHFLAQGHFSPKYFDNADAVEANLVDDYSSNGNIKIGSDVWIGNFSTLMSGVTVGDGAVIAANAHVVGDVLPYSIVGGNPAKHIKFRFSEAMIEKLMILSWWEFDDEIINVILSKLRMKATLGVIEDLIVMCQDCRRTKSMAV